MMRKLAIVLAALWVTLLSHVALAAGPAVGTSSVWVNQLGSTMTITIASDGSVTGTYVSAVGCGAGTSFPLAGWYNNLAITFTVNWQHCDSLTAWTGHWIASGSQQQFVTLWYLAVGGTVAWDSTVAGADTFTLQ